MFLKTGVKLRGLQPEILLGVMIVKDVFSKHGLELTITAALDGNHMQGSLHYAGQAVDVRTKDLAESIVSGLTSEIKLALGKEFDVVFEVDHLHVEFDPKD